MNDQTFLGQVKNLLQIGDVDFLQKLLTTQKITNASQYSQLFAKLKQTFYYDVQHQVCKNGSIEVLQFLRSKSSSKDFNIDFADQNNQNCLHYAVQRNNLGFVKYILLEDQDKQTNQMLNKIDINMRSQDKGESPLFFALSKLKSDTDKIKMVNLLLQRQDIDVGVINNDKKLAFEAYNNQFSSDPAANLIEKAYILKNDINKQKNLSGYEGSMFLLKNISTSDQNQLLNKQTPLEKKEELIESHIFDQALDLNYKQELQQQLLNSKALQDRFKHLQHQSTVDSFKYIDKDELKKALDKRLMEFTGMTLIRNIKDAFA
ncbi:UNKNOWN [Stylonychia lemnae]|uniref:Uncharacterized protein n=1 Tax=Stylonychia lemnae TaxID=5949 RepID=A0A078BE05_STYLE|nr:UNKNOWN [Stylonychia lemnae]|eukprot:CDW91813.1 UNKNOWN [Stylonychia lemnae]